MTTVRQVLQNKGTGVWSITPGATVYEALELMASKDVGALAVMDESGRLVGIFTERIYARKVALQGRTSKTTRVSDLMSAKVYVTGPDETLESLMQLMTVRKVRHVPVVEGEKVVGLITIGDVVKSMVSQQQFTIQQLERYITGPSYPET